MKETLVSLRLYMRAKISPQPKHKTTMKTFTATIQFPSRQMAKDFARAWAFHSKRGHAVSATDASGLTSVILDKVTDSDRDWIDSEVEKLNSPSQK